jgi:Immunity protein 26
VTSWQPPLPGRIMSGDNYSEGDWFAVPLREGGFAVGVIARATPCRRGVLLGYFFGPKRESVPALEELNGLSAANAVLVERFGHLGLVHGTWPLLGCIDGWDRSAWPMPAFGRLEEFTGRALKVIYDDNHPNKFVRTEQVPPEMLAYLPKDGLSGAGAVEIVLTGLLR